MMILWIILLAVAAVLAVAVIRTLCIRPDKAVYEPAAQPEREAEYAQKLSVAAETSQRMVKEAVQRGQEREAEIVSQANAQADAIRQKAAADIAQEKKKALNDAKDEISGMAMAIAEKVVGRELNAQDQERLVDSFIDALGDGV